MAWLRDIDVWFADHVFPYQPQHRRFATSLVREPGEAEELVQEAYARLFALENWAQIANPHAFTMRIIRNLAIERFRRADIVRFDQSALLTRLDIADDGPTPERIALDRAELREVARAMEDMPPRMREALYLRRIEGLRPAQVAERMNIAVSTVETHLIKALRLLVQTLNRQDAQGKAEHEPRWETSERREKV